MTDEVFDLDALAAEGAKRQFKFKFDGAEFVMPPMDMKWATIDDGQLTMLEMFKLLLGDEQWQRIVDSDARLTEPMFIALLDQYTEFYGVTPGESRASRRSSKSTARPSKRTSSTTTKLR